MICSSKHISSHLWLRREQSFKNPFKSQSLHLFFSERIAEKEQEAEITERDALLAAIEEHKRLEAENQERIKNRNIGYQRDLDMQIDYQRRVKAKEIEEEEREFRMGQVSN